MLTYVGEQKRKQNTDNVQTIQIVSNKDGPKKENYTQTQKW